MRWLQQDGHELFLFGRQRASVLLESHLSHFLSEEHLKLALDRGTLLGETTGLAFVAQAGATFVGGQRLLLILLGL